MSEKLNQLSEDWKGIDSIIIYGLGLVAEQFIDKITADFYVPYIIDNKKQGGTYKDIPIVGYAEVKEELQKNKKKVVVMTSQRVYSDIRSILEADGFAEMRDFCKIEQFAVEWYQANRNQINIIQVNTAVTTWCTLNCEKCNMFMPYYEDSKREHYTFATMKEDIDLLLKFVDYIFWFNFLGGEPFLNKDLKDIIMYVGETYPDKIGQMGITTNGTIVPKDEILQQLKKFHVLVSISDYSGSVSYAEKLERVIDKLNEWGISFRRNIITEWKDFGFPQEPFHWGKDGVYAHMKNCSPLFHGVNDKKLYYCHVVWSAEKAGIYTVPGSDYIDLTQLDSSCEEDKRKVSRYCAGECERGFLGFCMLCGGCGTDNTRIIPVGVQK